jgi:hypothetical protein
MKIKITDIEIDPKELEELNKTRTSRKQKDALIKKIAGGICVGCTDIPTKIVSYDISDSEIEASLLERYCDKCLEKSGIGITPKVTKLLDTSGKNVTYAKREKNSHLGA